MTKADAVRLAGAMTGFRLIAAPVIAGLIFFAAVNAQAPSPSPGLQSAARIVALGMFIVAALTDLLDGWIARRFDAVTPLGAALDHAADKALTSATLVACAATLWTPELGAAAMLLIVRDVAVAGLREGLAGAGRALPVDALGKWKAGLLMAGLIFGLVDAALLGWPASGMADAAYIATRIFIFAALALALLSGGRYLLFALRQGAASDRL